MPTQSQSVFEASVVTIGLASVLILMALILVALVYLRGWFQLRAADRNTIPAWRLIVFIGGLVCVWAAVASPLATLDHRLLSMHMVQHLLLMSVAAPLILLGAPFLAMRHGLSSSLVLVAQGPRLNWLPLQRLMNMVTKPLFCWLAATAILIGWHFPAAFDLAMRSKSWHVIEAASFLAAGLLFWWPVIQPWPSTRRTNQWLIPLYLFAATLPCDALSAFLTFCGRVVYPHYLHAQQSFNISPLQDQEYAGALMWVSVTFIYLIPAVIATVRILSPTNAHHLERVPTAVAATIQPANTSPAGIA